MFWLIAAAPDANAVVCARGVYRAGCAGPRGAVVVRHPYHYLSQDDVMDPLKKDPDGKLDALLRLSSFPEFETAWENYIDSHWNKWAELERPRGRSIALYSKLYQIHQRIISLGEDNPIELVWGVGIAVWQRQSARVLSHIIEQPIESDS